jgi:carbon monoxide dehydrogenase subunit G
MTRIHEQLEADVPIEAAFDYIADFDHADEWDPNTAEARRLDGGPLGAGSRFELGVRMGGRTVPMEYRITEFERPARVVLVGEGSGVESIDDIRFERRGDLTAVDYRADIRLGGVLRLLQPFLGGTFAKIGREAAAGMRRELASLAGPSDGTVR